MQSWVQYGLDGDLSQSTPRQASGDSNELVVLGLKATRTHCWRLITEFSDGSRLKSTVHNIDIGPPPAKLTPFRLAVSEASSQMANGYVMVSQIQSSGDTFILILDGDADVVWSMSSTTISEWPPTPSSKGAWQLADARFVW